MQNPTNSGACARYTEKWPHDSTLAPVSGSSLRHSGTHGAAGRAVRPSTLAPLRHSVRDRRRPVPFRLAGRKLDRRLQSRTPRLPFLPPLDTPLETIDQIGLKTLLFGLPCMTAGLLIGSVMAQQDYGARYFSDPKILLTFVLWIAYVAMIFIRRASGLRGRRAVYLSSFVVLVVLFVWAANQFSAVHRFPTP